MWCVMLGGDCVQCREMILPTAAKLIYLLHFFFFFAYFCLGILSIGKVLHSVEVERECETTALYLVEQLH